MVVEVEMDVEWMAAWRNMCQSRAWRSLSGEPSPGHKRPKERASIKVQYDADGRSRS